MKLFQKTAIPTREEFHRFYAGEITVRDFCTERTNQRRIPPLYTGRTQSPIRQRPYAGQTYHLKSEHYKKYNFLIFQSAW